jgi:hypothetical protein
MSKTLSRLVFAVGVLAAPLLMIGCGEGEKPAATPPPAAPTDAAKPGEGAAPPAETKPAEGAAPAPTAPAEAPK